MKNFLIFICLFSNFMFYKCSEQNKNNVTTNNLLNDEKYNLRTDSIFALEQQADKKFIDDFLKVVQNDSDESVKTYLYYFSNVNEYEEIAYSKNWRKKKIDNLKIQSKNNNEVQFLKSIFFYVLKKYLKNSYSFVKLKNIELFSFQKSNHVFKIKCANGNDFFLKLNGFSGEQIYIIDILDMEQKSIIKKILR